jgi:hypothetical protein
LSLITLAPEFFSSSGFNPTRHAAPYTAISRYARGRLFVIATPLQDGWAYRIDYPYYSWAETVVRPRIERHDLNPLISHLNQIEKNQSGRWKPDNTEMTSAVKFLDSTGSLAPSRIEPDEVATLVRSELVPKNVALAM